MMHSRERDSEQAWGRKKVPTRSPKLETLSVFRGGSDGF